MQKYTTVLLTICISLLWSSNLFSQENQVVIYTHNLGKFYLYIHNQLVERAPQKQITFTQSPIKNLPIKIVFQDHELSPIEATISVKKQQKTLFVIHSKNGQTIIESHKKARVGQYLPGFVTPNVNPDPGYTGRLGCDFPVKFIKIAPTVKQLSMETNSMAQETIAIDLIKNFCLSVSQLEIILEHLNEEKSKIQIAKYAWPYIYDQENYNSLSPIFDSPETIKQILAFVKVNQ